MPPSAVPLFMLPYDQIPLHLPLYLQWSRTACVKYTDTFLVLLVPSLRVVLIISHVFNQEEGRHNIVVQPFDRNLRQLPSAIDDAVSV